MSPPAEVLETGLALAGCAASLPAALASAPAAPAALSTNARAKGTPAVSTASETLAALQAWARNSGYMPCAKEGESFWCKDDTLLGSHPGPVRCASDDALADLQR